MKNKATIILCILFMIMNLAGCTIEKEAGWTIEKEYVPEEKEVQIVEVNEETGEAETKQILDVKGESFKLVCEYDTGRYDISKWRVTDSKSFGMYVHTKYLPEGYEVYIDHVHADISLKATTPQVDGIIQDSMDDTSHAVDQNGFYINDSIYYYNIFAIEGYTEQFYELWGQACGNYGYISASYKKLSENNLIEVGTYAEKIQIVYDLSIKAPEETRYHTVSVLSEILIPINTDTSVNIETYDFLSGEKVE